MSDDVRPRRPGWWRRNRWGLMALVVLLPVGLAAIFANSWLSYFDARASQAVEVPPTTSFSMPGAEFETVASARLAADTPGAVGMPAGSELVLARLRVTPNANANVDAPLEHDAKTSGPSLSCTIALAASDGVGEWQALSSGDYGWFAEEGLATSACDSSRTEPYVVDLAFLVPESADSELMLRVESLEWLPRYLRMLLPPSLE